MSSKISSLIIVFLLIQFPRFIFAQDIIHTTDGKKIEAKILEITSTEIKYKKLSYIEGPTYVLSKSNIKKIIYGNGEAEDFSITSEEGGIIIEEYGQNIVWYHLFDLMLNDLTISYERIFKNGKFSFQIPIGIGFGPDNFIYQQSFNTIYTGFGINIYPYGQGIFRYFFGPSIRVGYGEGERYYDWGNSETIEFAYGKFLINSGIIVNPSENFSISVALSLGIKSMEKEIDYHYTGISQSGWFSIRMGYRF